MKQKTMTTAVAWVTWVRFGPLYAAQLGPDLPRKVTTRPRRRGSLRSAFRRAASLSRFGRRGARLRPLGSADALRRSRRLGFAAARAPVAAWPAGGRDLGRRGRLTRLRRVRPLGAGADLDLLQPPRAPAAASSWACSISASASCVARIAAVAARAPRPARLPCAPARAASPCAASLFGGFVPSNVR